MKNKTIFNVLVAGALAFAMVAGATAQEAKERGSTVVRIKGAARYSTGNNNWQPLKVGDSIRSGMVIQTAADSYVDLVLGGVIVSGNKNAAAVGNMMSYQPVAEQDVVRIQSDTVLAVDKLTTMNTGAGEVTETQLDLRSGKILGTAKRASAASRYEVKIPNGVAGIRGTIYEVSADGVVSVLSGSVVVAYTRADGSVVTQVVSAGYQYDARTGEVSPITDIKTKTMISFAKANRIGPLLAPTSFIVDQTFYYVSPTSGN